MFERPTNAKKAPKPISASERVPSDITTALEVDANHVELPARTEAAGEPDMTIRRRLTSGILMRRSHAHLVEERRGRRCSKALGQFRNDGVVATRRGQAFRSRQDGLEYTVTTPDAVTQPLQEEPREGQPRGHPWTTKR